MRVSHVVGEQFLEIGDWSLAAAVPELCVAFFCKEAVAALPVRLLRLQDIGSEELVECPYCRCDTLALTGCHTCGYRVVGDD